MGLDSDTILCSKLGNENFRVTLVGHIKCSHGPHLTHGPQVPNP